MHIRILVLAVMLAVSQAKAADQLIRLPSTQELEAVTKGQLDKMPVQEEAKEPAPAPATPEAVATPQVETKPAADAKAETDAKAAAETKPATESKPIAEFKPATDSKASASANAASAGKPKAADNEELDAEEIAARISKKLAELRAKRLANPPKPLKKKKTANKADKEHAGRVHDHWGYAGEEGPEHWGKLNPAWALCESGSRQSPIDIRDGIRVDLERIAFDYKPTRFSVIDNGHTVQVNMSAGNYIVLGGRAYELDQFHFHRPAEERINGKSFPMVAHLVHKDPGGRLAVVAVLIDEGAANDVVQSVWNNLPLEKNDPVTAQTTLEIEKLLPVQRDYYTYMGSLTTPPCSEGVLWLVMKEPIQMSPQQMAIFSRLYPMNARPIQNASGRMIKESN